MSSKFQKRVEDFICEKCNAAVKGNGFTNHCPQCLWSKHVDKNPGDRAEFCAGMMEPIGVEKAKSSFMVIHRCQGCGIIRRNSVTLDDNFDALATIAKKNAEATLKKHEQ